MKLRFKDKIFLAIAAFGLLAFLYNKITGDKEKDLPEEKVQEQSAQTNENQPDLAKEHNLKQAEIAIGEKKIKVQVADSETKRYQGLSDVESIGADEGMLFTHSEAGFCGYVMRGMKFNLDFIFIRGEEIVDIKKDIPKDFAGTITGNNAYDKILELNAGTTERLNILVGEKIKISNYSN